LSDFYGAHRFIYFLYETQSTPTFLCFCLKIFNPKKRNGNKRQVRLWLCLLCFHYFINCIHRPNPLNKGPFNSLLIIQQRLFYALFIHLMPVFSIILAIIFLDEELREYHVKGTILIFTGIFLTTADKIKFLSRR